MQTGNGFAYLFCLRSNLSNDNIISTRRPGLKTSMENDILVGLKSGQDLINRAAHPHQEFPGVTPPVVTKTHE